MTRSNWANGRTSISEIKNISSSNYGLDETIVDILEFPFKLKLETKETHTRIEDNNVTIDQLKFRRKDGANFPSLNLNLREITVKVWDESGDEIEEDTSCDSKYKIPSIKNIGQSMCKYCTYTHAIEILSGHGWYQWPRN